MSTVHLCLNDIFGVAVACEVIFQPGDTPFLNGAGALAVSGARSIRLDAEGNGSVTLLPGRYAVRFAGITNNTDTLLILVPDDDAEYALSSLICGGNWVLPLRDFLQKSRNLGDVADAAAAFAAIKQEASETASGVVQLASEAEVEAGTDTTKAVTPATLRSVLGNPAGRMGYEPKSAAFTALAGGAYALDTSNGSFDVTIDAALPVGGFVDFCDAEGTWNANPPTFKRNGHLLEGLEADYTDSAQGTFLRIVNADGTKGLRILESGTKPHSLEAPTISGRYVGQMLTCTAGVWTGSPTTFFYQWQTSDDGATGWTDQPNATYAEFECDMPGVYIRVNVSAANANGVGIPVPSEAIQIIQSDFPAGAVAYWKLDEESGVRHDATGNSYSLTDNNSVGYTAGKIGNAAAFRKGEHTYLSNGDLPIPAGSWTAMCWAKTTSTGPDGGASAMQFFDAYMFIAHQDETCAQCYFHGPLLSTINDTEPHLMVLRYNAETDTHSFFMDGQLASEQTGAGTMTNDQYSGVALGSDGFESYNDLNGWVDEAGVWYRALSDTEIVQLYNNGNGLSFPS